MSAQTSQHSTAAEPSGDWPQVGSAKRSLNQGKYILPKCVFLLFVCLVAVPAAAVEFSISPRAAFTAGQISYSPSVIHGYAGGSLSLGLGFDSFRVDADVLLGGSLLDVPLDLGPDESYAGGGFPWHNQVFLSASWRLPIDAPVNLWLGGGIGANSTYFNSGDVAGIATHPAISFDTRLRVPVVSWLNLATDFRVPLGAEPSLMASLTLGVEFRLGDP